VNVENLADEIRTLYRADPSKAERFIESFLQKTFQSYPPSIGPAMLDKLVNYFHLLITDRDGKGSPETGELPRLLSVLLGKRVSKLDLSSEESLEKLSYSLNTIFDTLNQIISLIHTTLLGKKTELKTIRQIIGSTLKGDEQSDSLQNYLNQIREAFLISHRAFRHAAQKKIGDILSELDPDRISQLGEGTFGFSPFHKGKLFEIYKEEFMKCKGWVESGRLMEEVLREFEKNCQKQYQAGHGRSS
jgi:hypothetical protein